MAPQLPRVPDLTWPGGGRRILAARLSGKWTGAVTLAALIALTAVIVWAFVRSGGDERRSAADFEGSGGITREQAESLAVAEARRYGLRGNPEALLARRLSFQQYSELAGERHAAFYGTPDTAPDAVVWVVSMRGEIRARLLAGDEVVFDNMVVVMDATNGEKLVAESYYDEYESGVRLPAWFTGHEPCDEADRGDIRKLFQSTCPYEP